MDKDHNEELRRKKLRLVDRYDNDDYSRYSASDYSDHFFEIGQEGEHENVLHPEYWEYRKNDFYGVGPKGYVRSDDRIYEDACEILMRHREVDASEIVVKVMSGIIFLTGSVPTRKMKKISESILEYISGVKDIHNELVVMHTGPEGATKKDLGIP